MHECHADQHQIRAKCELMSPGRQLVLHAIRDGYSRPKDMVTRTGLSCTTVWKYLRELVRKGFIEHPKSRGSYVLCPLLKAAWSE